MKGKKRKGVIFGVGVKGEKKGIRVKVFCVKVMGEGVMAGHG